MVHRLIDGAYIPVQAKGRSIVLNGEVHLVVGADPIADESILIVSGLIVDGGLGPVMMVVPAADFRRRAPGTTTVDLFARGTNYALWTGTTPGT